MVNTTYKVVEKVGKYSYLDDLSLPIVGHDSEASLGKLFFAFPQFNAPTLT